MVRRRSTVRFRNGAPAQRTNPNLSNRPWACRLTWAFAPGLEREVSFGCFSHVVAGCGVAVLRAWRAAGAGLAGFWRTGRAACCRADVPEVPADPGGREPPGRAGPLPGQPQVGGEGPGQAELGVA